jgi:hypothetical protein
MVPTDGIDTAPPRSPSFLQAKIPPMRPRSRTEAPKPSSNPNHFLEMLRKAGPPVAQLAKSQTNLNADDDNEKDDALDDLDIKTDFSTSENITPTLDGFRQHILKLNPSLASSNQYLVDRIAHQMVVRYNKHGNNQEEKGKEPHISNINFFLNDESAPAGSESLEVPFAAVSDFHGEGEARIPEA